MNRHDVSVLGGRSVPREKRSFYVNRAFASEAGRKGGHSVDPTKRSFAINRDLAREAGRKGGLARRMRRENEL